MALQLNRVVPWGRSLHDYRRMFALSDRDLQRDILDCASGPSSFNAEMMAIGGRVTSCDPMYEFSGEQLRGRIDETLPIIIELLKKTRDKMVWDEIQTPQQLGEVRLAAMGQFLEDYPQGLEAGRYRTDALPDLPFADRQFELALSAHLLFTYSAQFDTDFHIAAILEMLRVAAEVRVFPLLVNFTTEYSPHLQPVLDALRDRGYQPSIERVPYEFQMGGNEMLRVSATR